MRYFVLVGPVNWVLSSVLCAPAIGSGGSFEANSLKYCVLLTGQFFDYRGAPVASANFFCKKMLKRDMKP